MPAETSFASTIDARALARAEIAPLCPQGPVRLVDCILEEADLSRLDLTGWGFARCVLRRAKLTGAKLESTRWIGCKGAYADFSSSDLTEALFQSDDFNNASFRRSGLASASFQGCKLTGADFTEAKALGASFRETLLIAAKLPAFSFRKITLERLDLSQADLRKADFRDTVFEGCSLRDANLIDARFEGADLRGADLGGLRLSDAARFRGATISRSQAGQLLAELGLRVS